MFLLSLLSSCNDSAFHSQQVQLLRQQAAQEKLLLCMRVRMATGMSLLYFLNMVSNYLPDIFGIVCQVTMSEQTVIVCVPQCERVCPSVGGCAPLWEGVPQCVGECSPVAEGVPHCGRVCSSV